MSSNTFPGFHYKAEELSAYICSDNRFVLELAWGEVVRYSAQDGEALRQWLGSQGIANITGEVGSLIRGHYFSNEAGWEEVSTSP